MTANTPYETAEITVDYVLKHVGYDVFVRSLFNRSGDLSKDFAHATIGLATEFQEFLDATSETNAIEELGDFGFYGVAAYQVVSDWQGRFDASLAKFHQGRHLDRISAFGPSSLRRELNELLDVTKRWVGYGKAPNEQKVQYQAEELSGWIAAIGIVLFKLYPSDSDVSDTVTRVNVAKLLERYAGMTFSAERATHRDTTAEFAVMANASA